jgi:hypothetical protein
MTSGRRRKATKMLNEATRHAVRSAWQQWRDARFEPGQKLNIQAAYFFFDHWTGPQGKAWDPRFAFLRLETVVQWLRQAGDITD